jgi:hypothetical protein
MREIEVDRGGRVLRARHQANVPPEEPGSCE